MNSRKHCNIMLIKKLKEFIDENPDIRFIQALWCLDLINKKDEHIEDRFYEESEETLKKIKRR